MTTYRQPADQTTTIAPATDETRLRPEVPADASSAAVEARGAASHLDAEQAEARQRARYGGISWGAGFFGWVVAAALTVLLSGAAAAVVVGLGLRDDVLSTNLEGTPGTVGIAAAAIGFGVLVVAYFAGGYVAGRMTRFDAGKQGFAVWLTGLLLGALCVGTALLLGSTYGVVQGHALPSAQVPLGASTLSDVVAGAAALLSTLLMAIAGGKVGGRYHRKVDEAAVLPE